MTRHFNVRLLEMVALTDSVRKVTFNRLDKQG